MKILIIEDDPMVEFIHRNYLEKIALFDTIYSENSFKDAQLFLQKEAIDLVLLDIHLKDGNGIDLLHWIRESKMETEVIVISAATQKSIVQQSFHLGILDYLIKPFTFERFKQSMELSQHADQKFSNDTIQQAEIDKKIQSKTQHKQLNDSFFEIEINEKGITKDTYQHIVESIRHLPQPFTIQDIVDTSELSHVSIRKYISYLEREETITSEMIYLKVGRPYKAFYYQADVLNGNTPASKD